MLKLIYYSITTIYYYLKLKYKQLCNHNCTISLPIKLCGKIRFIINDKGNLTLGKDIVIMGGAII